VHFVVDIGKPLPCGRIGQARATAFSLCSPARLPALCPAHPRRRCAGAARTGAIPIHGTIAVAVAADAQVVHKRAESHFNVFNDLRRVRLIDPSAGAPRHFDGNEAARSRWSAPVGRALPAPTCRA